MTKLPPEFLSTEELLQPTEDAWLLPDGTLYACEPPEHSQCATWIVNNVFKEERKEKPWLQETHPRTFLEKAGALLIRGSIAVGDRSVVQTNGQAALGPTAAQLSVMENNRLSIFNTLNGQVIDGEVYEKAANMMSEKAKLILETNWFLEGNRLAQQHWDDPQIKHMYREFLIADDEPNSYEPGMFTTDMLRYGIFGETESVAHFARSPLEERMYMGDPSQADRDEVYEILAGDFIAGMEINIHQEYEYSSLPGKRTKKDNYRFRMIPVEEDQCCLVTMDDYYHDGLSQEMIPYSLETTVSAQVLSYSEARAVITHRIERYKKGRIGRKIDIVVVEREGDVSLLPDIDELTTN